MKIGFGSDHAAIELKACLIEHLKEKGYECVDFGAYSPEEKLDYPIAGRRVAEAIRRGEVDKGVLVCGTGVGISLAANKVPGIRAGVCSDCFSAKMIKQHNHCQIIAMGQRYITKYVTKENDRMVKRVGLHSYYSSRGLNVAEKHVDFFGRDPEIDRLLVNKYDFCSTGMTHVRDGCDWTFCQNYIDFGSLDPLALSDYGQEITPAETEADAYYQFEQLILEV